MTTRKGTMDHNRPYELKHLKRDINRAIATNDPKLVFSAHERIAPRRYYDIVDYALGEIAIATNNIALATTLHSEERMNQTLQKIALKHRNLDAVKAMTSTDWQEPTVAKLKALWERAQSSSTANQTAAAA